MKIIDFIFSNISAKREKNFQSTNIDITLNFLNVEKDKIELKDIEVYRIDFKFVVSYKDSNKATKAELNFEGQIIISIDKNEAKDLSKSWKKKEVPLNIKTPLFNLILKKCSIKSLVLEEDLKLPSHVPLPKISPK